MQTCLKWLDDYRQYHGKRPGFAKGKRRAAKWMCPPQGRLKINVDGSYMEEQGCGGIGVIIRNDSGMCMAALSRPVDYAHSVIHVEAEAMKAGLLLAIYQGWDYVEVETDCAMLVDALKGDGEDWSMIGRIVGGMQRLSNLSSVGTSTVKQMVSLIG